MIPNLTGLHATPGEIAWLDQVLAEIRDDNDNDNDGLGPWDDRAQPEDPDAGPE